MTAGDGRLEDAPTMDAAGPVALDALAFGIDHLDGILVVHLADGRVHAAWIRADAGFSGPDVAHAVRDAYRGCHLAMRLLDPRRGPHSRPLDPGRGPHSRPLERGDLPADPLLTLEGAGRVVLALRVKGALVCTLFDARMPLGMARLMATRIAAAVAPELPELDVDLEALPPLRAEELPRPITAPPPLTDDAASGSVMKNPEERGTRTLSFPAFGRTGGSVPPPPPGASNNSTIRWSPSRPPPGRVSLTEDGHARKLLAFLEARAPEPHVARLRVALRAGLTPVALDHPEALGADAMILLETAVEEILGVDRAELRSLP